MLKCWYFYISESENKP
ncbi:hypothetical protein VCHC78A1_02474A, partial [Vibrio cholerae HC-78A1]